jgi:hypothetical protein
MTALTQDIGTEPRLHVLEVTLEDIPTLPVADMSDELFADGPEAFATSMSRFFAEQDGTSSEHDPGNFADTDLPPEAIADLVMRLMPITSGALPLMFAIGISDGELAVDVIIGEAAIDAGESPREGGCACGYSDSECAVRRAATAAYFAATAYPAWGYPLQL